MSARHVILGLLRERPSHTYELTLRFRERLSPWQMNRGQVYRTVSTLKQENLIEPVGEQRVSERSGPTYRLTEAGAEALERWFGTRTEDVEPLRGTLLAKLAVAVPSDAPELLDALDWYERSLATQIARDAERRAKTPRPVDAWAAEIADRIADGAVLHRDAELAWARRVREFVKSWADGGVEKERGEALAAPPRQANGRC